MVIRNKSESERVIDLDGPDGNAFVLLGIASQWAKQLDLDKDEIIGDMKSGDYEHLLEVFDFYFGSFVVLERGV